MTTLSPAFMADITARFAFNEGRRAVRYFDSKGIPTIGIGFNLTRPDADAMLASIGVHGSQLAGIHDGSLALTGAEIDALFERCLSPLEYQTETLLQPEHFGLLSDARKAALMDFCFNLGQSEASSFFGFLGLVDAGVHLKAKGDVVGAHARFSAASTDLLHTDYARQVGARAQRNAAMISTGIYVPVDAFAS